MYWSHQKDDTKTYLIETSFVDGNSRHILINCSHPAESLVIDYGTNRLYYVYSSVGTIFYYDLLLKNVSVIFVEAFKIHKVIPLKVHEVLSADANLLVNSITVYKDDIYFAESSTNTIRKCGKDECKDSVILRNNTSGYIYQILLLRSFLSFLTDFFA